MDQEKFEELLLNQLSEIGNRMSSIETRIDERMSSIETRMDDRMLSIENKVDEKMSSIENRLSSLEQGMSWVRGKLEGRVNSGQI